MAIPDWSYSEDYYKSLLATTPLEIRTDPVKGKGLFATKDISEGNLVLCERALCCSQNLDDARAGIPVCTTCLISLETPAEIILRVSQNNGAALEAANLCEASGVAAPLRLPCLNAGCPAWFCSENCRTEAHARFHACCCVGKMTAPSRAAYDAFCSDEWVFRGIDLSDTHFLAFRFLALAVQRGRSGCTLEQAFAPVGQLIRAPISKFYFTYLIGDDFFDDVKPDDRPLRQWAHFNRFKDDQSKDPISVDSSAVQSDTMVERCVQLLDKIFAWSEVERAFYSARWSELLGAVLLNGQERSPNSRYFELKEHLSREKSSPLYGRIRALQQQLKSNGITRSTLDTSSRGQGVYTVGACFNHSCQPNIQVTYTDACDEKLVVHSLRDIKAGEELFISYIDEDLDFMPRQQQLYEHYLFNCACSKCLSETPTE